MRTEALEPFGLLVEAPEGTPLGDIDRETLRAWIAEHRVVVLRGIAPIDKRDLPAQARRLGPLQAWSFGSVHELVPDPEAENYLYTRREVPLHWDGAFAPRQPHYLFFQCLEAPGEGAGGATTFVDTTRVWQAADTPTQDRWRALRFHYGTERVAHYGGSFSQKLVVQHPETGGTVLRFAEPVDDLNPVHVEAEGLDPLESAATITSLREALYRPEVLLDHEWHTGDVVIADNHALLHGRRAFESDAPRHIRRVNVLGGERTWRDTLRDSLRIRRPEFMVAEIPILLIAALTATSGSWSPLATGRFALLTLLFFLLFHFGDMVNCYADRDLDALYKTPLSEAVYGLGVRHVRWQMIVTVALALLIAATMAWVTGRWAILALVVMGLGLGSQYSLRPLWLKGRGLLQIATLWAVIFVGPMLLVAFTLAPHPPATLLQLAPWLVLFGCYGAMQQGIIMINTAEDLPEDRDMGIRTSAIVLGFQWTVRTAMALVVVGGGSVAWALWRSGARESLIPLGLAWTWVATELIWLGWRVRTAEDEKDAIERLRPRARRMPLWITATAWATLLTVILS